MNSTEEAQIFLNTLGYAKELLRNKLGTASLFESERDEILHQLAGIEALEIKFSKYHIEERLVILPFSTQGLASVWVGTMKCNYTSDNGEDILQSGKLCLFKCTEEESRRHDAAADTMLKECESK